MSLSFTFLPKYQIYGSERLSIFEKQGTKASLTDFAILLGGEPSSSSFTSDKHSLENRTGGWWTRTDDSDGDVQGVSYKGEAAYMNAASREYGARIAVPYSSISSMCSKESTNENGVTQVEFGAYPQTVLSSDAAKKLDFLYNLGLVKPIEDYITTDSVNTSSYNTRFKGMKHQKYDFDGTKLIRFVPRRINIDEKLSNGRLIKSKDVYWVAFEPIKWLVDKDSDMAITEKIIFAGVQFKFSRDYNGDFSKSHIKHFIDNYFENEILKSWTVSNTINSSSETEKIIKNNNRTRIDRLNPDTTNKQFRRKMTDTEIIKSWIDSGQSVLLRGPSGIGKTERIKELYPGLIYIKLTNNMFPEKVVGSMNLQTGQNIPPDFAKQALLTCATDEERKLIHENVQNLYDLADEIYERTKKSDEKIVILLDELLNVKKPVQSLVYTLVLNRLVESGKGLKLPSNTVIVATGNQKKFSDVAEDLAGPLEKRFDHILDMEPKVAEWINEYAIPHKVHPAVVGYILTKYLANRRSEDISKMGYFYEEPEVGEKKLDKYGCKGKTNDPRGWVSVSDTLYAFEEDLKQGKFIGMDIDYLLEVSINTKLREEWAKEFIDYYNIPTLTVDEVVNHTYSQDDLPCNINERFSSVTALLLADENQVEECRKFIRHYCDPEYLQLYDLCWAGNDRNRILKITELHEKDLIDTEIRQNIEREEKKLCKML